MRISLLILLAPLLSGCPAMTVVPNSTDVPIIRPVTITWQPAHPYYDSDGELLYGLTRAEYNKLVIFMNDTNRYIQSYKLDNSHKRLDDLGNLMFEYDEKK